jgi:hypothetical protein
MMLSFHDVDELGRLGRDAIQMWMQGGVEDHSIVA